MVIKSGKPDVMNITQQQLLYFTAGVDIIHVNIENDLKHHFGMIKTSAGFLVELLKVIKIKVVYYRIDNANRSAIRNVTIDSLWKKNRLVGNVRTKIQLCHDKKIMPKGTKTL